MESSNFGRNGVRLRIVGDLSRFDETKARNYSAAELRKTAATREVTELTICANYGGRWAILQAANRLAICRGGSPGNWQETDLAPLLRCTMPRDRDCSSV